MALAAVIALLATTAAAETAEVPRLGPPPDELPQSGEPDERDNRLIVRVKSGAKADALAASLDGRVVHDLPALDAVVVELPAATEKPAQAMAMLSARPDVIDVERDATARVAETVPNDELFPPISEIAYPGQWGLQRIRAPSAWTTTTGSDDVTVAVLDTGVDQTHPDLAGGVEVGANFTDEGGPDDTSDDNGHGTLSAGVVAARTDNTIGIAGTCWQCRILPVKVMTAGGTGQLGDIAAGIVYAVDAGADVLNLSLGSFSDVSLLEDAVVYATDRDVSVVASAGNFGNADGDGDSQTPVYPAAYDEVLAVAASDENDARYAFSSFGPWVEIAAPGCNPSTGLDDTYEWFCGTSSSAPLVSGVLGLALAHEPDASRDELDHAVTTSSVSTDYVQFGRADTTATLGLLSETVEPDPPPEDDEPEPEPEPDPPPEDDDIDDGDDEFDTEPGLTLERVSGANRFDTAARLSRAALEPGVERVYLATGSAFSDALAAGAAAGNDQGPVLLTARDQLPPETRDELARLSPDEVVAIGGTGAIGDLTVQAAGDAAGAPVSRIAGTDRFDTAARLARERFDGSADTVYVATGLDFADALAAVPAAVADNAPVLLTSRDVLPTATRQALDELAPDRIEILGGTNAISAAVAAELDELAGDRGVRRLAGNNRFETAAVISQATFTADATTSVHLATAQDFPDALAGGAIAGIDGGPLLLVTRDHLPQATGVELSRLEPHRNVVLGGYAAISDAVEAAAGEASAAGKSHVSSTAAGAGASSATGGL